MQAIAPLALTDEVLTNVLTKMQSGSRSLLPAYRSGRLELATTQYYLISDLTVERYPYTIYYILGHNLERESLYHAVASEGINVNSRSSSYLVDADGIEHGAELVPIFGAIDIFGTRPQDVNACLCGVEYMGFFLKVGRRWVDWDGIRAMHGHWLGRIRAMHDHSVWSWVMAWSSYGRVRNLWWCIRRTYGCFAREHYLRGRNICYREWNSSTLKTCRKMRDMLHWFRSHAFSSNLDDHIQYLVGRTMSLQGPLSWPRARLGRTITLFRRAFKSTSIFKEVDNSISSITKKLTRTALLRQETYTTGSGARVLNSN